MARISEPQKSQRPRVHAKDGDIYNVVDVVRDIPGFEQDEELGLWMSLAYNYYDCGEYAKALQYLDWSLKKMPALKPYIFYYMRVCKHVISIPLQKDEIEYEFKLERKRRLPRLFKFLTPLKLLLRCKWCGRYTEYIDPNEPIYGIDTSANSGKQCGRMYPMPSWVWDSPGGRIYSYFRGSFSDDEFYDEFERDYDTKPVPEHHKK